LVATAVFILGWLAALFIVDGYDVEIPASRVRSLVVVIKAMVLLSIAGIGIFFLSPYWAARPLILTSLLVGTIAITLMRWTLIRALLHETFAKRAIVIGGTGDPAIATAIEAARFEYRVVGTVLETLNGNGLPSLGSLSELAAIARRHRVHEVILTNDATPELRSRAAEVCFSHGMRVTTPLKLIERYQGRVPLEWIDSDWFLTLPPHSSSARTYLVFRHLVDIFLSVLVSVPFLLLLPILAALIKLDSPGRVFFTQWRIGQHGRAFRLFKLRTMRFDAENDGHRWAQRADARVTRVGRFLRLTRMDEIPQVLNVLRGEMSFIGPRPEQPQFVSQLEARVPHYRARLAVKPGITGWAQVKNGYAGSVEDSIHKLEYDLFYVKNQCLRLDMQIVFHTLFTVLGFRGR
jgi:exopolysaccharide biosynthesis polyprenyl glycosylphosphotransferase